MKKETMALAKAFENLIVSICNQNTVSHDVVPQQVTPAPVAVAPAVNPVPAKVVKAVPAKVAPVAPAPVVPEAVATPVGPVTHDEVRTHLLPIIQSNQNAMTAVHGVLTGQFGVNELTSLPVASISTFMVAVDAALAAIPK